MLFDGSQVVSELFKGVLDQAEILGFIDLTGRFRISNNKQI